MAGPLGNPPKPDVSQEEPMIRNPSIHQFQMAFNVISAYHQRVSARLQEFQQRPTRAEDIPEMEDLLARLNDIENALVALLNNLRH